MWPSASNFDSIWGEDPYQKATNDPMDDDADSAWSAGPGRAGARRLRIRPPGAEAAQAGGASPSSSSRSQPAPRAAPEASAMDNFWATPDNGGGGDAPMQGSPRVPSQGLAMGNSPAAADNVRGSDVSMEGNLREPSQGELINNDFCEVCQSGGRLLLCERCPRAFHMRCIERFVDVDAIGQHSVWACPVCRHGVDVLRGQARAQISPREMQANMEDAQRRNRGLRRSAARRRDQFLAAHVDLVEPFATRPALTRIQRILEDRQLPPLDIGSSVKAVKNRGGRSFDAVVLLQTGMRKYVVADPESKAEVEVDRDNIALLEGGTESRQSLSSAQVNDFLGFAHKPVLSEGTVLKDYQAAGVNWLVHMFYNRCGGILADDMGLGKTIQTLSFISYLQTSAAVSGPFLVVAPLSCAGNWIREAKRFVPHLSVAKVCGVSREREFCLEDDEIWYGMKDIIVTTYETISSTADFFVRHCWSVVVLDEAHRIKNQASRAREVLDNIECASRLLLTGTPLQNNLGELFALLRFLWPDVLVKTSETFESAVRLPGTLFNGPPGGSDAIAEDGQTVVDIPLVERIRSLLAMLMLRRQKEEVTSLPPKVFHDIWLPLSPLQVKWYKTLLKCRLQVQRIGLRALLKLVVRLRQLSGHPRCLVSNKADREQLEAYASVNPAELAKLSEGQFSEEAVAQSGKLAFLDKLLGQLHAQNMGFSNEWRKAFEERQRRSGEDQRRRKHTSAWLRGLDGVHFLDDLRPYRQPSTASDSGAGGDAGGAADGDEDDLPRPHKVLIFSQFHACLDLLEEYCSWRGWRSLRLDGSTMRVLRELDMRDFNSCDEDYFVYLVGTRAGGLGVNLASANHVVLFDQDWNPHVDHQAIDRAHRIGQNRRVNVYKIVQEWGVEERLVHRQAQKLKMEQCVIQQDEADGEEAFASERLSGDEVNMLLRYGEEALKHFDGECIKDMSLGKLLERKHRPLLKPEGTGGEAEAGLLMGENQSEAFVEDDGEGGSHIANQLKEEEDVPPPPPPPPAPVLEANPGPVRRTSSGRAVRAPTRVYVPVEIVKKPTVKKEPLKHGRNCFACGKGPQTRVARRRGRAAAEDFSEDEANTSAGEPPADVFCSKCPKAYHSACLGPRNKPSQSTRWTCTWHSCEQCDRSAAACGGMLIHCLQCPTALCYDCFPPNFRRVYPGEKFWTDLNNRGWKVTPQQMVFFKCNSCRALEEQCLRKQMRAEDLEAQEDERKRAALEEKRNLAATKRQAEAEEARRRLRQVMMDHERSQLSMELQRSRERVVRAAEVLWPPRFWAIWLECCLLNNLGEQLASAAVPRRKGCWKTNKLELWLQEARAPLAVCANCGFPGHRARQCPLPPERVTGLVSGEEGGGGEEGDEDPEKVDGKDGNKGSFRRGICYRKVCPLCKQSTHSRVQCQALGAEDRVEYEARCRSFALIEGALQEAAALPEPQLPAAPPREMPAQRLLEAWRRTEVEVSKKVEALLRGCGLGHLAVRAGAGGRPLGAEVFSVEDENDAPEELPVPARAKAKAKSRAKAKGKGRGRGRGRPKAAGAEVVPRTTSRSGVRRAVRPRVEPIDAEEEAEEEQCGPEEQEVLIAVDDSCVTSSARGRGRGRGSRGGRRGRRGGSRGRGRGALAPVAAPKPKAKSTAMAQASYLSGKRKAVEPLEEIVVDGVEEVVPRAKGRAKAKAKSQPKVCGQEEERILIDGAAAGWSVRGSVRLDGSSFLSYKGPNSSSWTNPGQVSAPPSITCALEAEARDILQGLRSALGCGPPPVGPREARAPGSAPGPGASAPAPQGPPAPAQEPARAPEAGPPLGEAREIIRGPAVGWVIRGRVGQNHLVNFTFRRPGSTNWETINEAEGSMTKAARESIEREKLGIQERLLAKLQATLVGGPHGEAGPKDRGRRAGQPGGERHPQTEIMHVVGGIAAGWSVRVTVSPRGACSWDFREPQGIRWRSMKDLRQGSGDPVVCAALEAEQAAMASRFGHPLPSVGKGHGKRRTAPAEKGAFQAAFETPIEGIAEPEMEPAAEG